MEDNNKEIFIKLRLVSLYYELGYAICVMVPAMSQLKINCCPNIKCQRELEKIIIEPKAERPQTKREKPLGCPEYLGYLNSGVSGSLILKECLNCLKMTDCMLYKE